MSAYQSGTQDFLVFTPGDSFQFTAGILYTVRDSVLCFIPIPEQSRETETFLHRG